MRLSSGDSPHSDDPHPTTSGSVLSRSFITEAIGSSVTKLDAIFSIVCLSSEVDISGR